MNLPRRFYQMPQGKTLSCLGDSITEGRWDEEGKGWVGRFSEKVSAEAGFAFSVANDAVSGDCTYDLWHNLLARTSHRTLSHVIIMIGTNDIQIKEFNNQEYQQVPLTTSFRYLDKIFTHIKDKGWIPLIVGPIPVAEDVVSFRGEENYLGTSDILMRYENKDICTYNNWLEKFCAKYDFPFLRLFETWQKDLSSDLFTDGLHPSAKGHTKLAEDIFQHVKKLGWLT